MPTWMLELRSPDKERDVHVVLTNVSVVATDVDAARQEARRLLAKRGFAKLRALNFTTDGRIVAYLPGPNHASEYRKRPLRAEHEGESTVKPGGVVVTETPVWRRPPGPRRPGRDSDGSTS